MRYGLYFLITLLIELPVIFLLLKAEKKNMLAIFFLLNLFTWPLLHFIYYATGWNIFLLETGVFLAEAIGFQFFLRKGWRISLITSLLANSLSYFIGLLIT